MRDLAGFCVGGSIGTGAGCGSPDTQKQRSEPPHGEGRMSGVQTAKLGVLASVSAATSNRTCGHTKSSGSSQYLATYSGVALNTVILRTRRRAASPPARTSVHP